jgi:hypothetical protein
MTNFDQNTMLRLSIQRALLGEVTDRLIAVTCGIRNHLITIRAYMVGKCVDQDVQRVQRISAEVIADFPEGFLIEESCIPVGDEDPEILDFWAFRRAIDWKRGDENAGGRPLTR